MVDLPPDQAFCVRGKLRGSGLLNTLARAGTRGGISLIRGETKHRTWRVQMRYRRSLSGVFAVCPVLKCVVSELIARSKLPSLGDSKPRNGPVGSYTCLTVK